MVKPKFEFKVKKRVVMVYGKPSSKAEAAVKRKQINEKSAQIEEAVEWCKINGKKGYSALKTGRFPLIKDRGTIDRRLKEKKINSKKEHQRILTPEEERSVVEFAKNKNRCHQGISRRDITNLIIDVLKIRQHCNLKLRGGRKFVKLSANAKHTLEKERDDLAEELISCEIFKNAEKVEPGVWTGDIDTSRVFNHDETPQFVNYGVDATQSGLAYAARGESCKKMMRENRESVTICPVVSLAGEMAVSQVLFSGKGITTHMCPKPVAKKINNLLISSTEKGSQDNKSLLECYRLFDKYLDEKKIQRPVVMLADGHSSRFDYKVLKFLREHKINLFISPPDTTGVTQLLDQNPNQSLHKEYNSKRDELFPGFQTINREGFMNILGEIWEKWATEETILKAAKRVGISKDGLNVEDMQQDKFEQAALIMNKDKDIEKPGPSTPNKRCTRTSARATLGSSAETPSTPKSMSKLAQSKYKYGSVEYWKCMCEQYQGIIKDGYEKSLKLEEIPGLLSIKKVKPKELEKTKNIRITNVHGSMEAQDILSRVEAIEKEKQKKEQQKEEKLQQKNWEKEAFFRCKKNCVCSDGECEAKGLKQCPVCFEVKRSVCSKK
ncbi:uncharacterized protein [Clytia hemisphaerica]|uniref:uncharacterized protein n=1 Tax=Clytia hemisphaerica TaxID=252671 RepID=UPI0034D626FF